jgi:15-cis-phytoene synthase
MTYAGDYGPDYLRQRDYDRWLASQFVPLNARSAVQTILSFSAHLQQIPSTVSEPMLGEIRLQWWHDVFAGMRQDEACAHPLFAALRHVMDHYHLPESYLIGMIEARRFDFYDDHMPSMHDLEAYCGETCSYIFRLSALILNKGEDFDCADASGHAGVAYGLAQIMLDISRSIHHFTYIPRDLIDKHHVSSEQVMASQFTPQIRALMRDICDHMRAHLRKAEQHIALLPQHVRVAFLPLAYTHHALALIARSDYDVITKPIEPAPITKIWRLWRYARSALFR